MGRLLTHSDLSSYWGTYMSYFTIMYNNGLSYYDILINSYMLMGCGQYNGLTSINTNNYCVENSYMNHNISNGKGGSTYVKGTDSEGILYFSPYLNGSITRTKGAHFDRICVEPRERYFCRVFYFRYKITLSDGRVYGYKGDFRNGWVSVNGETLDVTNRKYVLDTIPVTNDTITGSCEIYIIDTIATKDGTPQIINKTLTDSFTIPSTNQNKLIRTYKYSSSSPFYNIDFLINFNNGDTLYIEWGYIITSQVGNSIDNSVIGVYQNRTYSQNLSGTISSPYIENILISSYLPNTECYIDIYIQSISSNGPNIGYHNNHGPWVTGIGYDPLHIEKNIHWKGNGYGDPRLGAETLVYTYNELSWITLNFKIHMHG